MVEIRLMFGWEETKCSLAVGKPIHNGLHEYLKSLNDSVNSIHL